MWNFEAVIDTAIERLGGGDIGLAVPFEAPRIVFNQARASGKISGYVLDTEKDSLGDEASIGWWSHMQNGCLKLSRRVDTLAILGAPKGALPGPQLLREAARTGVRRVVLMDEFGVHGEFSPTSARTHLNAMLGARLQNTLKQAPFDDAFKAFLAAFEGRFALPPSSFDPSRLALVIGSLGPGGAERQLSYLASSVAQQKRFDVKVLVSSLAPPGDFFLEPVKSSGADVHVIDGEAPLATDPDSLAVIARLADAFPNVGLQHFGLVTLRIADMLRKVRPGILHTWMDYNNVLAGLAAELVGVPRLVMAGRSVAAHNFTIFQPYMRPGYRALFQRRNVVFLNNSDAGARDYECWLGLPDGTVKTVHNGFEIPKIDDIACRRLVRERHGVPLDAPTVGGLQRFSEEKRPSLVVDAAIELARRRPSAYALIFGDGPLLEPERRKVEAAGFADRIKLPGLTRAPYEALSAMDVFVLASRMEGLPNVLVEAQLMGVPVVCTGSGGMRETFQEAVTGLVARAATASAIADALEVIVADSGRQAQMATLAKAFARAHFTLPAMVEATLALYDGHGPVFDV